MKINHKLSALVFIITSILNYGNINAISERPSFVSGKVVYSDNYTPVTSGIVRVVKGNNQGVGRVIEAVNIGQNGIFKLSGINVQNTDGIKVIAYASDVDNLEASFETTVVDGEKVYKNSDVEYAIIIEVKRIHTQVKPKASDVGHSGQSFGTTVGDAERVFKNSDKEYDVVERVNAFTEDSDLKKEENNLLKQNYPNPFNPTTLIKFELPQTSNVTLKVYNMNGEAVATLIENKNLTKGFNTLEFNASSFPSGIYVYTLQAGNYSETRKMMLLK